MQCLVGAISAADNKVTLNNHRLKTGDKVQHFSTNTGLGNSSFFVSGIDTNTFKLCDSYENAIANHPVIFDIPTITVSAIHTF